MPIYRLSNPYDDGTIQTTQLKAPNDMEAVLQVMGSDIMASWPKFNALSNSITALSLYADAPSSGRRNVLYLPAWNRRFRVPKSIDVAFQNRNRTTLSELKIKVGAGYNQVLVGLACDRPLKTRWIRIEDSYYIYATIRVG